MLWTLTAEHSVVSSVTMIAPQVTLLMVVALQLQCLFSKSYLVNTGAKTEDSKDGPHHSASKLASSNKALPAYPADALTRTLTKAIVRHVPGYQEGQEGLIIWHIYICLSVISHCNIPDPAPARPKLQECSSDADCAGYVNTGAAKEFCFAGVTFAGKRCMTRLTRLSPLNKSFF